MAAADKAPPFCLVPLAEVARQRQAEAERTRRLRAEQTAADDAVRADRLTPVQRKQLWAHIQKHEPDLHAWLLDPAVRAFSAGGDASVLFPRAVVRAALGENSCP